jgi:hypothetical protein
MDVKTTTVDQQGVDSVASTKKADPGEFDLARIVGLLENAIGKGSLGSAQTTEPAQIEGQPATTAEKPAIRDILKDLVAALIAMDVASNGKTIDKNEDGTVSLAEYTKHINPDKGSSDLLTESFAEVAGINSGVTKGEGKEGGQLGVKIEGLDAKIHPDKPDNESPVLRAAGDTSTGKQTGQAGESEKADESKKTDASEKSSTPNSGTDNDGSLNELLDSFKASGIDPGSNVGKLIIQLLLALIEAEGGTEDKNATGSSESTSTGTARAANSEDVSGDTDTSDYAAILKKLLDSTNSTTKDQTGSSSSTPEDGLTTADDKSSAAGAAGQDATTSGIGELVKKLLDAFNAPPEKGDLLTRLVDVIKNLKSGPKSAEDADKGSKTEQPVSTGTTPADSLSSPEYSTRAAEAPTQEAATAPGAKDSIGAEKATGQDATTPDVLEFLKMLLDALSPEGGDPLDKLQGVIKDSKIDPKSEVGKLLEQLPGAMVADEVEKNGAAMDKDVEGSDVGNEDGVVTLDEFSKAQGVKEGEEPSQEVIDAFADAAAKNPGVDKNGQLGIKLPEVEESSKP